MSGTDPGNLNPVAGSNVQNYSPGPVTQELFFRRIILSGEEDCCIDTSEVVSVRYDSIQSDAYAGEDKSLPTYKEDVTLEAAPVEIGKGEWTVMQSINTGSIDFTDANDPNAIASNLGDGDNVFLWTVRSTFDRCPEKTDEVIINVRALNISSGFSPNGDNINDKFVIDGFDEPNVKGELIITNLSGMVVYRSKDGYDNEWDGRDLNNNPLPDGTYYYFLNVTAPEERQEKGYIIIKRTIVGN